MPTTHTPRLSDTEKEDIKVLADLISTFVNRNSEEATSMLGRALCNDHRTLIQKKGRLFRGFIKQLRDDHASGRFDLRNEALCQWAVKVEDPCLPFI
jgi:hypothetical protein